MAIIMPGYTPPKPPVRSAAYFEEPPERKPPITEIGALAWVRANLFGSPLDTTLTLLGVVFVLAAVSFLVSWSIESANWYSVIFNLRLFLIGRVEQFMNLRLTTLLLYLAALTGVSLAAWSMVRVKVWAVLAAGLLALFVIPWLLVATIPLPPTWLAAGQLQVSSGSITASPQAQVAFIAAADDEIVLRLVPQTDESLASLSSFGDTMSNTLRNAAANRLAAGQRIEEVRQQLAGDRLTDRQRAAFEAELEQSDVPPPINESWQVSAYPVTLTLSAGDTGEQLAQQTIGPGEEFRLTLPQEGWYLLEKQVAGSDESIATLAATGIYPIFDRNFIRDGTRVYQYVRSTDRLLIEDGRPRDANDENLPMLGIIDHQYKGRRSTADFLRLMLAPFLQQLNLGLTLVVAVTAAGYYGAKWLERRDQHLESPRARGRRLAVWFWAALLPLAFILIAGFGAGGPLQASDPQLWGGFLLTMLLTAVGIVGAFPIGILLALGRRSRLPVVSLASTLYIEVVRGVPLITVLFMSMLLVPFVLPGLRGPDSAPYRAMVAVTLFSAAYLAENVRGGLQSLSPGQEEAARALGLPGWRITLHITLPQALRAVIPALVGQCISLYKDTSLVAIVGLIELTGVATLIAAQTEFQGLRRETYIFISIIYFIFCAIMSVVSRRVEASGSGAARA